MSIQVLACRGDSLHVEVPLEVGLDLGRRPRFAHLAQVIEHQPEQRGRPLRQVVVDRLQRRLHTLPRLPRVEHGGIDRREERRIQLHRLRDHLAIGQQAGADHLDPRQRRRRVENPKRRVIEIAAGDEPFVGLVDGIQRVRAGGEELNLRVALADLVQPGAETGDGLVMGIQQPPLGQQRMHERVADRAFDGLAELGPRHQERVDVHATGVQRQARLLHLLIVDGHQRQVDVGLRPDGIVRQAAAEDGRQDRAVLFHLLHQIVERLGELLLDGSCRSAQSFRDHSAYPRTSGSSFELRPLRISAGTELRNRNTMALQPKPVIIPQIGPEVTRGGGISQRVQSEVMRVLMHECCLMSFLQAQEGLVERVPR